MRRVASRLVCGALYLSVLAPAIAPGADADIFTDHQSLTDALGTALGCQLSRQFMADIEPLPLYRMAADCQAVVPTAAGSYYGDPTCTSTLEFEPTTQLQFCRLALDTAQLGAGSAAVPDTSVWTLNPGNRYDLGARSLDGLIQPYMSRLTYKEVETTAGTCRLEMRIYRSSPIATGQRSLLALHGGSWTSRGFGFFGLEMTVPHFTAAGFVVFAPFYRLLGNSEGPLACQNATIEDIVQDAADALDWVTREGPGFGGNDYPVVFGQSAGGHLAAAVAVQQPASVAGAVLYYSPVDFTDFVERAQAGEYTNPAGLKIMERVARVEFGALDITATPIPENSFPTIVAASPTSYPPMFLLHGFADDLVEARQSIRLCSALSGNGVDALDSTELRASPELRQVLSCDGRQSELHLIREGRHALDVCVSDDTLLSDAACLSGSEASRVEVAQAVGRSAEWARVVADQALALRDDTSVVAGGGSGGGSFGWWSLAVLLTLRRRRARSH